MSSSVQTAGLGGEVFGEAERDLRRFVGTFGAALVVRFFGVAGNVLGENFGGAGTKSGTGAARWWHGWGRF